MSARGPRPDLSEASDFLGLSESREPGEKRTAPFAESSLTGGRANGIIKPSRGAENRGSDSRGSHPGERFPRAVSRGRRIRREGRATLAEGRARAAAVTCDDCFFRRRNLCALALDNPCPTFRPDTPDGLVPPRQPSLLMRDCPDEPSVDGCRPPEFHRLESRRGYGAMLENHGARQVAVLAGCRRRMQRLPDPDGGNDRPARLRQRRVRQAPPARRLRRTSTGCSSRTSTPTTSWIWSPTPTR